MDNAVQCGELEHFGALLRSTHAHKKDAGKITACSLALVLHNTEQPL